MEGQSHFSDYYHAKFLERFKGKISTIGKNGHMGVASSATRPVVKPTQTYAQMYSPAADPQPVTFAGIKEGRG